MTLHAQHTQGLQGVLPDLLRVISQAQGDLPPGYGFQVGESGGLRDEATQQALVDRGSSQTLNSRHRTGSAVDLIPTIGGRAQLNDDAAYGVISQAMMRAAQSLGVPLEWGGDWQSFVDKPHYQLAGGGANAPTGAPASVAPQAPAQAPPPDIRSFMARMSVPGAEIAPPALTPPPLVQNSPGTGLGELMARLSQPLGPATQFDQVSTSQGRV